MDKPSVGRIVHYGTPGGEFPAGIRRLCRAAIITEVYYGPQGTKPPQGLVVQLGVDPDAPGVCWTVGLCVLNPTGQFFNRGVPYDADRRPGTWHWPERI